MYSVLVPSLTAVDFDTGFLTTMVLADILV
jgi:hypothetical protein